MITRTTLATAFVTTLATTFAAGAANAAPGDTPDLSLEELLKVEVTTASRKSQQINDTAAAVFVITRDDILRSGATSIHEVLRMAPGVNVARIAANRYAVSVRGFTSRFANKLQVLIDGRSVYSPVFSGVFWEAEGTILDDVERIEVIRGPGGSLWGDNAVNAVINIITRKTRDTKGGLLVVGTAAKERRFGAVRYGDNFENGVYRVWAQANTQEPSSRADGSAANDKARTARVGFRSDWTLADGNRMMVSGGGYDMSSNDHWLIPSLASRTGIVPQDITESIHGGHLLARHEWALSGNAEAMLQAFVNDSTIKVPGQIEEQRTTFDIDFQRRDIGKLHDLVWGVGYRNSRDRINSAGTYMLTPDKATFALVSAFVQDEWTLVPDRLRLIGGLRIEHNNYTGSEPQPSARFIWTPSADQSVWGAASRAIRTPSRGERDGEADVAVIPSNGRTPPVLVRRVKGTAFAEKGNTYELGYRMKLATSLSLDVAAFVSDYDDLRASDLGPQRVVLSSAGPYVIQTLTGSNSVKARSRGFEITADWQIAPWWRLQSSYANLDINAYSKRGDATSVAIAEVIERTDPRHQITARSSMTFAKRHQIDLWLRYVSEIPGTAESGTRVARYTELNARYGWRAAPGLDLSIGGQNLLKRRHTEFVPDILPAQSVQFERDFYVKAKWQF
jgi:iron complex outermembrane receptor protein